MTDAEINRLAAEIADRHLGRLADLDAVVICEVAEADLTDRQIDAVAARLSWLAGYLRGHLTTTTEE